MLEALGLSQVVNKKDPLKLAEMATGPVSPTTA